MRVELVRGVLLGVIGRQPLDEGDVHTGPSGVEGDGQIGSRAGQLVVGRGVGGRERVRSGLRELADDPAVVVVGPEEIRGARVTAGLEVQHDTDIGRPGVAVGECARPKQPLLLAVSEQDDGVVAQ